MKPILYVAIIGNGRTFVLLSDLEFKEFGVTVPAYFSSDFASVPRFAWSVFPPIGRYAKAAVLHDYIYRTPSAGFTRAQADEMFRLQMKSDGVGQPKRDILFLAVRIFGASSWKRR